VMEMAKARLKIVSDHKKCFTINTVKTATVAKQSFFEKIIKKGGEGVVLKNLDSPYNITKSRPITGWIKMKKEETIDAFISDYVDGNVGTSFEGKVGALILSCYLDGRAVEVARVSGIDSPLRDNITLDRAGYIGKCVELSGQEFTARNHKLKHAKIIQWRNDKTPEDCIITMKGGE